MTKMDEIQLTVIVQRLTGFLKSSGSKSNMDIRRVIKWNGWHFCRLPLQEAQATERQNLSSVWVNGGGKEGKR